jgi:hypothetical protein
LAAQQKKKKKKLFFFDEQNLPQQNAKTNSEGHMQGVLKAANSMQ